MTLLNRATLLLILLVNTMPNTFGKSCSIDSINFYQDLKKKRVLYIENATYTSSGHVKDYDVDQASVGWLFGFDAQFKNNENYSAACCEFRQYLAAKWIKDDLQDLGDGKTGFSQTNKEFRKNLISWPKLAEDTGGAYGHRDKIVEGDKWQDYSQEGYFMRDEPGTGGAKKSHDIIFKFDQRIIDICNDNRIVINEVRELRDNWSNFKIDDADIIIDLDD